MSNSFSPGDRVAFEGRSGTTYRGTIRYIGPLTGKGDGEFLGVELRAPHGTMARGKDLFNFTRRHKLKLGKIDDLIAYRLNQEK